MKKVGIITIYQNNRNYGGLLQAYALQKAIESQTCSCDVINYTQNGITYKWNRMRNLGFIRTLEIIWNKVTTKIEYQKNPSLRKNIETRNKCLSDFEHSIPHTVPVHDDGIEEISKEYDVLVCGSDQIWNPGLWSPVMLLDIPGYEGKKFSYAASIGRNHLTSKEKDFFRKHASGLEFVSVREKSAEKLIQPLLSKKVETVLDPTFLLDKDQWESIAQKPEGVPEQFVFSFFLGENPKAKKVVYDLFAQKLPIVMIPHLQTGYKEEDEAFSTIQLYNVGPREWVWLILNAKFVFTDSFHGTAFSVNLNRSFFSFPKGVQGDKQSINSRLSDLLKVCEIENRFVTDVSELEASLHEEIDWDSVNGRVKEEREAARYYLAKALGD